MSEITRVLAVDPGVKAAVAVAVFEKNRKPQLEDLFIVPIWSTRLGEVDVGFLIDKLLYIGEPTISAIERVHSFPKQGVASSFKFGICTGAIIGTISAMYGKSLLATSPSVWKSALGLSKAKKDSINLAKKLFGINDFPLLGKDHNLAEAALIAAFMGGWRP